MRRGAALATTLIVGLGVSSLAGAVERSRTTRGWVSAVDTATKTIKVKGKNDVVAFKLEDAAKVMENKSTVTFAELKPGEHVMIRYTGTGAQRMATEVDILAQAASASGHQAKTAKQ